MSIKIKLVSVEKIRTCFGISLSAGPYVVSRVSKMAVEVNTHSSALLIFWKFLGNRTPKVSSPQVQKGRAFCCVWSSEFPAFKLPTLCHHPLQWAAAAHHPYGAIPLIASCAGEPACSSTRSRKGSQDTLPCIHMRSCTLCRGTQWEVDPCGIWRQQITFFFFLITLSILLRKLQEEHSVHNNSSNKDQFHLMLNSIKYRRTVNANIIVRLPWDARLLIGY